MRIIPILNPDELPLPDMVCRTCTEPLIRRRSSGGDIFWAHGGSGERDHEVDPMPRSEAESVKLTCDFCSTDEPVWAYHTKAPINLSVQIPNHSSEMESEQISHGSKHGERVFVKRRKELDATDVVQTVDTTPWAACPGCAELIEIRDVNRLVTRARRVNSELGSKSSKTLKNSFGPFMRSIDFRTDLTTG